METKKSAKLIAHAPTLLNFMTETTNPNVDPSEPTPLMTAARSADSDTWLVRLDAIQYLYVVTLEHC